MRNKVKNLVLACGLLALLAGTTHAGLTPGPFAVRVPAVKARGSLDYSRMHWATMYLSYSTKYRGKIVGRVTGNVYNASRRRQVYKRANVGSSIFSLEARFFRSTYRVYRNGSCTMWALGHPK